MQQTYANCPKGMPLDEWTARVDLAALYRLVALEGWDDLIFTHISVRVPGSSFQFFLNPFGMLFEEVTASNLVKMNLDGKPADFGGSKANPAGFNLHSGIYKAREDVQCIIHLHTLDGVALSAVREGLLPLTQQALIIGSELAYHDYEGIVIDPDERKGLVADLGTKHLMILRNHGTLAVGPNCGAAWLLLYNLERACAMQLRITRGGESATLLKPSVMEKVRGQSQSWFDGTAGAFLWPAFLRKLDRINPDFRN